MDLLTVILSAAVTFFPGPEVPEKGVYDTLSAASVASSVKIAVRPERLASPSTSAFVYEMEQRGLGSPRDLSAIVPNLHVPDYGSSVTSSVYLRGFGSRIDNPVLGLYIDDIPILDKNNYDFDFLDIRRADLLRGPQGTLFGRNAMTGVLNLATLGPSSFRGGRASLSYGSGRTFTARGSWYGEHVGVAAGYRHTGGFYTNTFDGRACDPSDAASFRLRHERTLPSGVRMDQNLTVSWLEQGGWPYRQFVDGELLPVDYNDKAAYRRVSVLAGNKLTWERETYTLYSVTSLQGLFDRMDLDQDFTRASMFTLTQRQRQGALTQEVVFKPVSKVFWWDSQSGVFAFVRYNAMHAPVDFKPDGIRTLILDNANAHIPEFFGKLSFEEEHFVIGSDFGLASWNAALYHESYFTFGRWLLTAGLRIDHEGHFMSYDSRSLVHYRLTVMPAYRAYETVYAGDKSNLYFQVLPKISALYDAGDGQVYLTLSKGFKAGGFNTQIFSDLLQNEMMNGMMADMGVHLDGATQSRAENTSYKPETSLNAEIGGRWHHGGFSSQLALFYIACRNQQITVFPPGKSTGRMMANAGRSESYGAEAEVSYVHGGLRLDGAWGSAHAVFKTCSDGHADYAGCRIPYAPEHTLSLRAAYRFTFADGPLRSLTAGVSGSGVGRIWWNEDNSLSQPFYLLAAADLTLSFEDFDLFVVGNNLTDREFDTFYFKSVGHSFFQRGKPRRVEAGIRLTF